MAHVCRNFGKYSVSTCAPAVATHMQLRLGMRPPHAWPRLPRPSLRWPTRTAGIQALHRRSVCMYQQARPYGWISARPALRPGRCSRLLAARATPQYQPTKAEPKKPCQTRGCGSGEPRQQPATKVPEHNIRKAISKGCQHACGHRRRVPPRLLISWAMVPRANTHIPTRS